MGTLTESLIYCNTMISREFIESVVAECLADTEVFVVSIVIGSDKDIVVELDSLQGVDMDFCANITRQIREKIGELGDDYSLEVGSYSISKPFVDVRHYAKNIGRLVEVNTVDNKRCRGVLSLCGDASFSIEVETKELQEGSKRKKLVKKIVEFAYSEVRSTKLDF